MKPTTDDVLKWARSVGMEISKDTFINFDIWELKGACSLADEAGRKDENEACAKVCDDIDAEYEGHDVLATWCSAAIRARGNQ